MTNITIFKSKGTTKAPISPFDDKTFIFETVNVPQDSNTYFYNIIVSHFILNIPLDIAKPIRTQRTVSALEIFQAKELNYIIIDIAVQSETNKNSILEYFKDYKVIIGESRGYNSYDNFNLKGVLFTDPLNFKDFKIVFANIQNDIKEYGYLNDNSIRKNSLTAPILKNKVLFNNQDGVLFTQVKRNISEFIAEFSLENEDIGTIDSIKNITGKSIQEICLGTFRILGYAPIKENNNSSITFSKLDYNNELDDRFFWFKNSPYIMHHPNRLKSVNIFNTIKENKEYKNITTNDLKYSELLDYDLGETYNFNEEFLEVQGKEDLIEAFLHKRNGLLSIKSPMNTGKSNLISYIIDECHSSDLRVLIITNRISVAEDFSRKYNSIKLYNKDQYNINDSLIVQYDSLWKYSIVNFDVVIMDEFTSLMLHSRENLTNNSVNLVKFFGCFSKKLIIADAFLTGYEHIIIQKTENIVNIVNDFRDPTGLTKFMDKNRFMEAIINHSIENAKFNTSTSISCTSMNTIIALKLILEKHNLKVITLTADTPKVTKELIYEVFNSNTPKWDVLIYSPTLTVGVSNMNQVEDHFHYDSGNSADVISSIQMIKRSRRAKNIHYYIQNRISYVCTDYNTLRDTYLTNKVDNMSYLFDTDDYGEIRLSKVGSKAIKIDVLRNILKFNHMGAFEWLLKFHFKEPPRIISETSNNIVQDYLKEAGEYIKNSKLKVLNDISDFNSLSDSFIKSSNPRVFEIIDHVNNNFTGLTLMETNLLVEDCVKDPKLLSKIKYFKIFTMKLSIDDINSRLSLAVLSHNKDDVVFYSNLLGVSEMNMKTLKTEYTQGELQGLKHFRGILVQIGYDFKVTFKISKKVQKYKDNYVE